MLFKKCLTAEQRAFALFLHREKRYSLREVAIRAKMSKTTAWHIVRAQHSTTEGGKKFTKRGCHKKLTARDSRKLNRALLLLRREDPNFTVMDVVKRSGIPLHKAHYRTFCREIKELGYSFRNSRRKGILTENHLK